MHWSSLSAGALLVMVLGWLDRHYGYEAGHSAGAWLRQALGP